MITKSTTLFLGIFISFFVEAYTYEEVDIYRKLLSERKFNELSEKLDLKINDHFIGNVEEYEIDAILRSRRGRTGRPS